MSDINEEVDAFLAHFGVKGMKWGVINKDDPATQPTTKQESKTAARNASAQKYTDKANDAQRQIDKILATPGTTSFERARNNRRVVELKETKRRALDDAKRKQDGKLSKNQKKVAIGAAIVAGTLVAYGGYKMGQSGELSRKMQQGKSFVTGKPPWKEDLSLSRSDLSVDQLQSLVVSKINPDYGAIGTKVNCRRCTFAYEMRRRGFDVAATRTTNGAGQDLTGIYNALTPSGDLVKPGLKGITSRLQDEELKIALNPKASTPFADMFDIMGDNLNGFNSVTRSAKNAGHIEADIFDSLRSQPSGARGELSMSWLGGSGHSVAWEIVGGKPIIFDTQNGKVFKNAAEFSEYGKNIDTAGFTRLDDMPMNVDFLQRWMTNA